MLDRIPDPIPPMWYRVRPVSVTRGRAGRDRAYSGVMNRWVGLPALAVGALLAACTGPAPAGPDAPGDLSSGAAPAGAASGVAPTGAGESAAQAPMLADLRSAAHPDFDRVVLEFTGPPPKARARVAPQLVQCGSGIALTAAGARFLVVTARPVRSHDEFGRMRYQGPRQYTTPALTGIESVAIACDWEGELVVGIGLADPDARYAVSTLADPGRIVVDVPH